MNAPRVPGDLFSGVSSKYAEFRPRYPRELFDCIAAFSTERLRAWDCGAGNGQATTDIVQYFDEVVGTDVSASQLSRAPRHTRIHWVVAAAEASPLRSQSVDLITIAQALHWFDHAKFYGEVQRVAKPGAIIAAWTYGSPQMDGEVGTALDRLMYETLGGYWPPGRRYIEEGYRSIPFPFERLPTPPLLLEETWTLEQVAGYARSWSAAVRYTGATSRDAVESFERAASPFWSDGEARRIEWPLILLVGRVAP